jgi:outer membrane lipoprotein-sorting protein
MQRRALHVGAAILALALTAGPATAETVDQVVARYLEARGGLARLRSVQSLRLTGTMSLPGVEAPFVLELKRPAKMRTEFTVEGRKGIRAFDGKTAWMVLPLPGEEARPMPPDEADEAREQADVDFSPLVDAAAKSYAVELVGREPLPGGDTWKLVVRGKDGPARTMYLDTKTHLVVRTDDKRTLDGREVDFVTEVGDYRSVEGLVFPHRIDLGPKGSPDRQRLTVTRIEVNPALDDERFTMPKAPRRPTSSPPRVPGRPSPSVLP